MVLKNRLIWIVVSILSFCFLQNIHATDYSGDFQRIKDLYAEARNLRKQGSYRQSKNTAEQAVSLLAEWVKDKEPRQEDEYVWWETLLDLRVFLLDLSIGRGNQDLTVSMNLLDVKIETAEILAFRIRDEWAKGGNPEKLQQVRHRYGWPRADHANVITRALWEMGEIDEADKMLRKILQSETWDFLTARQEMERRLEYLGLLTSLTPDKLDERVQEILERSEERFSVNEMLYRQALPETLFLCRKAAETCIAYHRFDQALLLYNLIESKIVQAIRDGFSSLSPEKRHDLWEIMRGYMEEIHRFAYEHRELAGAADLFLPCRFLAGAVDCFVTSDEISESLDENEAAVEIFCLPSGSFDARFVGVLLRKNQVARIIPLPLMEEIKQMNAMERYRSVWLPIRDTLKENCRLYISGEELLGIFSFASVRCGERYLIDDYEFRYVSSCSKIPSLKSVRSHDFSPGSRKKDLFFFGGIDFMDRTVDGTSTPQGFQYLQGSLDEIEKIAQLLSSRYWNIHKYTGSEATESTFRNLPKILSSHAVLHVSTHSFYLLYNRKLRKDIIHSRGFSGEDDPFLRVGFALAGANAAWNGKTSPKYEDGILMAADISAMDFSRVELAVLSGCNTGRGDRRYGEGILGLPRAFRQAGVKSLLISYREIGDSETAIFMEDFYRHWQDTGDRQKAFLYAQRKMRARFPDEPYKWDAFVLIE